MQQWSQTSNTNVAHLWSVRQLVEQPSALLTVFLVNVAKSTKDVYIYICIIQYICVYIYMQYSEMYNINIQYIYI